jgi:hypothetical protein
MKLDTFTLAYIECALWSSHDESTPAGGEPMDRNYCIDDIAPATLEDMAKDCAHFQKRWGELLEASGLSDAYAGHDFWLTRNRHGAGFWDRDLGDVGKRLTEIAHAYGEVNLYIGDDGKVHS